MNVIALADLLDYYFTCLKNQHILAKVTRKSNGIYGIAYLIRQHTITITSYLEMNL